LPFIQRLIQRGNSISNIVPTIKTATATTNNYHHHIRNNNPLTKRKTLYTFIGSTTPMTTRDPLFIIYITGLYKIVTIWRKWEPQFQDQEISEIYYATLGYLTLITKTSPT
jgi:hypothetical protein